jgi:hypothetical protein
MSQPRDYTRNYNFNDFQTTNPSDPLPASQVDNEFNDVKLTLDDLNANIALIQRDDGKIANASIHKEALSQDALALVTAGNLTPRGDWTATTVYAAADIVNFNDATYLATVAHTAVSAFATDLAAGNWILIANAAIAGTASAVDKFEGDGSQTVFTLTYSYTGDTDVQVYVNGSLRNPGDDYSISTNTLTFVTAPSVPAVAGNENVIVWGTSVVVEAAKSAAQAASSNASGFATTAQDWAEKTSGPVTGTSYSSKYWATSTPVTTVSTNIADVTTVAGEISPTNNIATVASRDADIGTVAARDANIGVVAARDTDIGTVAARDANIGVVAARDTDIGTVASRDADIGTVASRDADIGTVASRDADIGTLAPISADITSVAGKASLITSDFVSDLNQLAVSDVIADINLLATSDIVSDINILATSDIVSDLNQLATSDIVTDINLLATSDVITDLNLLATSDFVADLNLLATSTNVTNLDTVATSITDVTTAATSMTAITDFNDRFFAGATQPSSPVDGDLFYDTSQSKLYVYVASTSSFQVAGSYLQGLTSTHVFTATAAQTTFTTDDASATMTIYANGNTLVFLNGVRLVEGTSSTNDYYISGNSIVLNTAANAGQTLLVEVFTKVSTTQEASLNQLVTDAQTAETNAAASANAASTSETNAAASAASASSDATSTAADVISTNADVVSTNADVVSSAASASAAATSETNAAASATQAAASAGGGTLKVTAADTTADTLVNKLAAGTGVTLTTNNAGGNETMSVSVNPFALTETNVTATAGQTTFTVSYGVGLIQVFMNGAKLISGSDFTATNGTSVVLASAASAGQIVEFVVFG